MMPPINTPVSQLSKETGISEVCLYNWRKQAPSWKLFIVRYQHFLLTWRDSQMPRAQGCARAVNKLASKKGSKYRGCYTFNQGWFYAAKHRTCESCHTVIWISRQSKYLFALPFLDGVYRMIDGKSLFQVAPPPTEEQLQKLLHQIMQRLMQM